MRTKFDIKIKISKDEIKKKIIKFDTIKRIGGQKIKLKERTQVNLDKPAEFMTREMRSKQIYIKKSEK
jgi:hypothetical protein